MLFQKIISLKTPPLSFLGRVAETALSGLPSAYLPDFEKEAAAATLCRTKQEAITSRSFVVAVRAVAALLPQLPSKDWNPISLTTHAAHAMGLDEHIAIRRTTFGLGILPFAMAAPTPMGIAGAWGCGLLGNIISGSTQTVRRWCSYDVPTAVTVVLDEFSKVLPETVMGAARNPDLISLVTSLLPEDLGTGPTENLALIISDTINKLQTHIPESTFESALILLGALCAMKCGINGKATYAVAMALWLTSQTGVKAELPYTPSKDPLSAAELESLADELRKQGYEVQVPSGRNDGKTIIMIPFEHGGGPSQHIPKTFNPDLFKIVTCIAKRFPTRQVDVILEGLPYPTEITHSIIAHNLPAATPYLQELPPNVKIRGGEVGPVERITRVLSIGEIGRQTTRQLNGRDPNILSQFFTEAKKGELPETTLKALCVGTAAHLYGQTAGGRDSEVYMALEPGNILVLQRGFLHATEDTRGPLKGIFIEGAPMQPVIDCLVVPNSGIAQMLQETRHNMYRDVLGNAVRICTRQGHPIQTARERALVLFGTPETDGVDFSSAKSIVAKNPLLPIEINTDKGMRHRTVRNKK